MTQLDQVGDGHLPAEDVVDPDAGDRPAPDGAVKQHKGEHLAGKGLEAFIMAAIRLI
jgi:hypothetical protein